MGRGICRAIFMIGDTLKKEREKQKISIQDVEQGTSIRSVYIDAIEKGEYDKLPGEVYAKGFIKNYGNFLNLNGEELVRQFIMEISTVTTAQEENPAEENQNTKNTIAATNIGEKYTSKQQISTNENYNSEFEDNTKKYLVAAAAFIAILLGGIFYNFGGSDEENITIAQSEVKPVPVETQQISETPIVEEKVAETPATVETQKPVETPAPEVQTVAATPAPVEGVNLQATFSGDCWTRVIVDGTMFYEGMISAGESFDWKGNQSVSVLLGNAGAVQFVMNGQSVGAIGGYGDVVERDFTR